MLRAIARAARTGLVALCLTLIGVSASAKDGGVEINGAVQSMPAAGLVGEWKIGGKSVVANASTVFDQENGKLAVGAIVEAKGQSQPDGSVLASKIEVKQGVGGNPTPPPGDGGDGGKEFTGAIETLPAAGFIGDWKVAGRTVRVVITTRLDQEDGGFVVGATVEVRGTPDAAGIVIASAIETKSGGDMPPPPPAPGRLEIEGVVETLPAAGLIGTWRVSGRDIVVNAATVIDQEHGAIVVGTPVEVKGAPGADGIIVATKIESEAGNGAGEPALEFFGAIEALPPAADGFVGVWRIDGRTVNVTPATKLKVEDGPIAVGAIVEVSGWTQADGTIEAHEIETRKSLGAVAGAGSKAVEFVNAQLGHFFVTAFPPEIATLDAGAFGGAWKRTGESFNVGAGTAGVCRFYGAPPKGPDSHFFTADPAECAKVMRDYTAWTFEAHAFAIAPAVAGSCAAGLVPVKRFYNNPATGEAMNHRYVVTAKAAAETLAMGWTLEGVVMCAQP